MKRVFAILLVLAMVLSLSIPALAAEETGSITITNATVGEDYAVYKIFDANIKKAADGTTEAVAYSIETDNQFFSVLFGADGKTENTYFAYNPDTHAVTKKEGVNDSELIKYLEGIVKGGTYATAAKAEDVTSDEVKFEGLPYGYYMILSSLGATVTINSNTPDVKVIDKNQEPGSSLDKQVWDEEQQKWVDANSANIGDEITYKIEFTAANYDGDKQIKHYQIHDEKGDAIWAEFNSIEVWVDGVELPRGYYLSQGGDPQEGTWLWLGDGDNSCNDGWDDMTAEGKNRDNAQWYLVHLGYDQFRITIPWLEGHTLTDVKDPTDDTKVVAYSLSYPTNPVSKYDSPAEVVITYDCVVEPGASIGSTSHGNRYNKAYASWTSESETGSTPPDEVVTQVFGIGLLKDDAATLKNLAGAKFRIYKDKDCTIPVYIIPTDAEGVYIVDSYGTPSETISGDAMKTARDLFGGERLDAYLAGAVQENYMVTPVNGKVIVLGLEAGKYYLKEVEAPDGYNALNTTIELEAGKDMRTFNIFLDKATGKVADIQQTDGTHVEVTYDLTYTTVHNSKGVELPSTGGKGTIMLITFGSLVAMGFAILLITQKKMSIYKG